MGAAARHVLRTGRLRLPILVRNALLPAPQTEALSAHQENLLRWYNCGPTVYDDAHLGHARAYVTLDLYRRLLQRHTATTIHFSLGVTDIDDKILTRAAERAVTPSALAAHYEARFFEDMNALNVLPPTSVLRVSEFVPDIIDMTSRLVRRGAAYVAPSGSVYFSVAARGSRYNQLDRSRGQHPADSTHVPDPGVAAHRAEKRAHPDFALWKAAQVDDPLVWSSPWSPAGRPGWHVECAAMALAALGPRLDLHAGGIDLRFPHHTNELAAAEADLDLPCGPLCSFPAAPVAATGNVGGGAADPDAGAEGEQVAAPADERWAHTWLHVGHLHMSGRKMSKSLKNFVTVRDFLAESVGNHATAPSSTAAAGDMQQPQAAADEFRLFCLATRFDAPAELTPDRRAEARATLAALTAACAPSGAGAGNAEELPHAARRARADDETRARESVRGAADEVERALARNLDGPGVLRALRRAARTVTGGEGAPLARAAGRAFVAETLASLGFSWRVTAGNGRERDGREAQGGDASGVADRAVEVAVRLRARARHAARAKDAAQVLDACDAARDELGEAGVRISDAKDGTSTWTRG